MYSLAETPRRNQHDCWPRLFLLLSRSLQERCGWSAERSVREAVRRMEERRGDELRKQHIAAGKADLQALYSIGPDSLNDPRFYADVHTETDEMRIWEVRTCPNAAFWSRMNSTEVGSWFCEEYQHAFLKGYTGGMGQMNLSKRLTCTRDNHCCFSAYYRRANRNELAQADCPADKQSTEDGVLPEDGRRIRSLCIRTYSSIFETAAEQLGDEGIQAVAVGLRAFSDASADALLIQAERVGSRCDRLFVAEHFAFNLDMDKEPMWNAYAPHEAQRMFLDNVATRLTRQLAL